MFQQSAEQLIPFLQLLDQPAFCLDAAGAVTANAAAKRLAPGNGDAFSAWLGDSELLFSHWDRSSVLELPVLIRGNSYIARFNPLSDGTVVLLTETQRSESDTDALSVVAQAMMQPLTNLHGFLQQLEEIPALDNYADSTAAMTRQVYQLTRVSRNLSDLAALRDGIFLQQQELVDVRTTMTPLLDEIQSLCSDMGRTFEYRLPTNAIAVMGNWYLLERAILNLVSNALKYGDATEPIVFRAEPAGSHLLIRVSNRCSEDGSALLRSAFTRLEDRGRLPDPRWGIGLGLPLVQYIARIHGGMVAVEVSDDQYATVSMSLSRRRTAPQSILTSGFPMMDLTGGLRPALVELSDVLPSRIYTGV